MSHVSHLYHGALADWCEVRFTGSAEAADRVAGLAHGASIIRPAMQVDKYHWDQAGKSFANRVAALVEPAPPYSALYGLVKAGLVTTAWAHGQASLYPMHRRLPAAQRERALDFRPTLNGWMDLLLAYEEGAVGIPATSQEQSHRRSTRPGFPDEHVLAELFDRMRAYTDTHARLGQLGTPGRETGLMRVHWLLAAFGYAARNDSIGNPLFRLFRGSPPSLQELHGVADDSAISDPLALIDRLRDSGALEELRRLAGGLDSGQPLGIARPVIFDHWEDSIVVLNGPDGSTLLDVVALIRADGGKSMQRRICKLITTAWLDTDDAFRIRSVGLYLARHGVLVTWPVGSLADVMLEGREQNGAKAEFVTLAHRLRAEDRARRLAWRAKLELPENASFGRP